MFSTIRSKKTRAALTAVAALAAAAVAVAYWTASGSGTGSGSTASGTQSVTVNQTSSVTGLYPGGPAKALSGNFDNPNDGPAYVTSISASVTGTSAGAACGASNFEITGGPASVNQNIAAGNGKGSWSGLEVRMLDTSTNQDACKGVTLNISYSSQ